MKSVNLIIIAVVITALVVSRFLFQPTTIEAHGDFSPSVTPTPVRKIKRRVPRTIYEDQTDSDIQSLRRKQNSKMQRKRKSRYENMLIIERRKKTRLKGLPTGVRKPKSKRM